MAAVRTTVRIVLGHESRRNRRVFPICSAIQAWCTFICGAFRLGESGSRVESASLFAACGKCGPFAAETSVGPGSIGWMGVC